MKKHKTKRKKNMTRGTWVIFIIKNKSGKI